MAPQDLAKQVDLTIKNEGSSIKKLFSQLEKIALLSPRTGSKGFFNLLYGGKILPAVMAEIISSVLNNTMHTFKSGGIHILIEQYVIDFFLTKVGYKNGDGTLTPG